MSDENLAEIRNEKAKKIQHPKGKLTAYERLDLLLDEDSFSEIDQHVASEQNPEGEAVITGTGTIHGRPVFVFSEAQEEELIKDNALKWAEKVYESMTKNSFSLERYKAKLQTLGKIVEYPEGRGWAEDINDNGSLRIKTTEGEFINLTSPLISEVN